ncbi:hypothetical protein EX30DRAFT_352805 [Ascodesmis nigricans]|uniref:Uncharacterized protein n=1 Tax=Ascodesmis nigricans TaxID=341454 RepID=A0A4S2MM51_9PEZI|nr:hypothetical protein EX30DRAFT_352805 [Ascodesmis nigricans]
MVRLHHLKQSLTLHPASTWFLDLLPPDPIPPSPEAHGTAPARKSGHSVTKAKAPSITTTTTTNTARSTTPSGSQTDTEEEEEEEEEEEGRAVPMLTRCLKCDRFFRTAGCRARGWGREVRVCAECAREEVSVEDAVELWDDTGTDGPETGKQRSRRRSRLKQRVEGLGRTLRGDGAEVRAGR